MKFVAIVALFFVLSLAYTVSFAARQKAGTCLERLKQGQFQVIVNKNGDVYLKTE